MGAPAHTASPMELATGQRASIHHPVACAAGCDVRSTTVARWGSNLVGAGSIWGSVAGWSAAGAEGIRSRAATCCSGTIGCPDAISTPVGACRNSHQGQRAGTTCHTTAFAEPRCAVRMADTRLPRRMRTILVGGGGGEIRAPDALAPGTWVQLACVGGSPCVSRRETQRRCMKWIEWVRDRVHWRRMRITHCVRYSSSNKASPSATALESPDDGSLQRCLQSDIRTVADAGWPLCIHVDTRSSLTK